MRALHGFAVALLACTSGALAQVPGTSLAQATGPLPSAMDRNQRADMPEEIAALALPRSFSWTGTTQTGRGPGPLPDSVTNFRVTPAPDEVRAVVREALTAAGWQIEETRVMPGMVFTAPDRVEPLRACRDGRALIMSVATLPTETRALFTLQRPVSAGERCFAPPGDEVRQRVASQMPRLAMPMDPQSGMPSLPLSGGGSGTSISQESRTEFRYSGPLSELPSHFARQLAAQGWQLDTEWSGQDTAGSSWTRPVSATQRLQGTLLVTALGEGLYSASFRALERQ